jgi:putative aminopeptidase FrvX
MEALLMNLVESFGPTGAEDQVRAQIQSEVESLSDEVSVDKLGNLIAVKRGKGERKVILAAHMDEIGIIVKFIDENGFARFTFIGNASTLTCIGSRVQFSNGTVGVIFYDEKEKDELKKSNSVPALDKMYVDIGATSRADCPVGIGDPAVFTRPFVKQGNRIIAKSLDNRIGCVVLIETLRRLKDTPFDVFFVFTVQEEEAFSGAITAAYGINPDIAIAVDVTLTGDTPNGIFTPVKLGEGPVITVKDKGIIAHHSVRNGLIDTANQINVPYQLEVCDQGGTDASVMQVARDGVPAGNLCIPCRYLHSPSEIVDLTDVENTIILLTHFLL